MESICYMGRVESRSMTFGASTSPMKPCSFVRFDNHYGYLDETVKLVRPGEEFSTGPRSMWQGMRASWPGMVW